MMRGAICLALITATLSRPSEANAQGRTRHDASARDSAAAGQRLEAGNALRADDRRQTPSLWSAATRLSGVWDSNIDRNDESLDSYGAVAGLIVHFEGRPGPYRLRAEYDVAMHRYSGSDRWNRISHRLRGAMRRDLSGRWQAEVISEISLKGSSEDRSIGNQYVIEPRLIYQLNDESDVRFYAAVRIRRFEDEPDQNALNRYAGVEFAQEVEGGAEWEVGFRYELNDAESDRRRYRRRTWHTEFTTPIGSRDEIELELKVRSRRYTDRYVEIEDDDVLRRDHRWIPAIEWTRRFWQGIDLVVQYEFETRASNDPDRGYSGHQFGVAVARWW